MANDDEERKYVHSLLGEGSKLPLKVGDQIGRGGLWTPKGTTTSSPYDT